jgi:hypothetical protein
MVRGFNPRSPRGERRDKLRWKWFLRHVSTHALIAEERQHHNRITVRSVILQPTLPAWGATKACISLSPEDTCFNPRSRVGSDAVGAALIYVHEALKLSMPRTRTLPLEK